MSEGVPVSATDELRERLVRAVLRPHPKVELRPGEWVTDVGPVVDELAEVVAAVVAEARTEQREADAQIAESLASSQPMPCCVTHEIERRGGTYVAEKIAAALRGVGYEVQPDGSATFSAPLPRGVGNQNAEPRWSANRLEEVLREGLPDQNAEPEGTDHV